MKNSEMMYLLAQVYKKCGYDRPARLLEESAVVYEAREILGEDKDDAKR